MTSLVAQPQFIASAAADFQSIESALEEARAAAAGPTTGVVAAAEDEISALPANFFNNFAKEYQSLMGQAGALQNEFAQLLAGSGNAYAEAELAAQGLLAPIIGEPLTNPVFGPAPTALPPVDVSNILIMTGSGTATPPLAY